MKGIEEVDEAAATMTVLAGTPLQTSQEAAKAAGLFFALDMGARGSCRCSPPRPGPN
jgi:FAD/FMN-containing dehydrogenase